MRTRIAGPLPTLSLFALLSATSLVLPSCGDDAVGGSLAPDNQVPGQNQMNDPLARKVVVLATDYSTGNFAVVDLDAKTAMSNVGPVHSDPTGRLRNKKLYVINRLNADNIQVVDPSQGYLSTSQFSVGNGANPQDIAFVADDKIYVSLLERDQLGIFNPLTGMERGKIDLSAFNDADGTPEMGAIALVGQRAYVALQGLDRNGTYAPVRPGELAVIDTAQDALVDIDPNTAGVQGIRLRGQNPNTIRAVGTNTLYVSSSGNYSTVDTAGIERVSTEPPYATDLLVDEARLGGDVTSFVTNDGDTFFLVLSINKVPGPGADTALVRYRASINEVKQLLRTDGYNLAGIALTSKNELVVCDRTATKPGVRIFDGATGNEITTAPIDVGLPPSVVLAFDDPAGVLR